MFLSLSKKLQRMLVFTIMFFGLSGMCALVYFLLNQENYEAVMIVSTVTPAVVFTTSTLLYLRIIGEDSDVPNTSESSPMYKCKRKLLGYVSLGFILGVPAVYFIMHGVTQNLFATIFPLTYIFVMSVATMAFLPVYLKTTGAIAPIRYMVLAVALFVILLKVGCYLNSYLPGNLTEFLTRNLFFALGCGNLFLLFLLHSAWHQVFTLENVVVIPLNQIQTQIQGPTPTNVVYIVTVPPESPPESKKISE